MALTKEEIEDAKKSSANKKKEEEQ